MYPSRDDQVIGGLREQLSAAVGALDLGACLSPTAERLVAEGDQIERLGHAIKTLAAARVAEAGTWRGGAQSAEEWLASTTGSSKAEAADTLSTGRRLAELPATETAVRHGKLSRGQAKAVAEAASSDASAEQGLLDTAQHGSLGELKNQARRVIAGADPDPEATRRRHHEKRSCRHWTDPDGLGHLHASGPSDELARVAAAIGERANKIFDSARAEGRRESLDAYAFDALVDAVTQPGDGPARPAGADAKIIVRVDHDALMRGHTIEGETCEIAGIGPVAVSVVREWMADAFIAAILTKGTDVTQVVHLGRRFTAVQKTALQWRDPECCVKGCTNTVRLEYDHDRGWANTHQTTVDDGDRLCRTDHKRKSAGWWLEPPDATGKRRLLAPHHPDHPLQQAARRARGDPPAQTG